MRYFNPVTMTEVLPGVHDMTGAIALPDDNWFFTQTEMPQGKVLAVNERGEPILVEISSSQEELAE
ncbi:TPA: hypothetical protein ACSW2U_001231 [Enterobacter roggenkampii]|uniref:hypothetical protein n=1 Tax=Enterobacteriaceae TaxID=543 RepID=UPI000E201BE8|nr:MULTISPECIES: hypothetical protein [Enterobacteriaceae]MCF0509712.1 hypothetical protein [Klebsiella pneumoniae]MCF0527975.1 hypothetical protein [Klebsiella pneumoniae]MCJ4201825.1 hypothetical protein [Klebsiella pneumoniae]MCU4026405.1 hypothetical protein [Enterobacter roggenkampii]MUC58590.1 hypothetical protein [Klebsiella pneumoniae]